MVMANIPTLPRIIRRPRLERLLERSVEKRLTLVTGSPGQGKTTLVASVLHRLPHNVFWYSLDPSNSNPSKYISDLLDFLKNIAPMTKQDVDSVNAGSIGDTCTALTNLLDQTYIENQLVIVLDDFQTIEENSEFADFTQLFIAQAPLDFHFIIISRHDPKWKLAQKTIQRKMLSISDTQLAFRPEECHTFYKEIYQIYLSPEQMEHVMDLAEGWTPVLVMVGEMLANELHVSGSLNIGAAFVLKKIPILDSYLNQECFNNLSSEQQNVLMAASMVDEIPGDLVKILAGSAGEAILNDLFMMNMLIQPVDGKTSTFKMQSLWKSFLLQKAAEMWNVNEIHDLHRKAGDYFFVRNNWKAAIYHYVQSQEVEKAIEVLKRSRPEVLGYELADRLHLLILKMPVEKKEYDPWMSFALSCSFRLRDPSLWHHYLSKALDGFRRNRDDMGESYALGHSLTVLMYLGDFRQMNNLIAGQAQYTDSKELPDPRIAADRCFYAALAHCYSTGNLNEAVQFGGETRKIGLMLRDDHLRIWAAWILATAHWFIGNFDIAQKRLAEAFEILTSTEADDVDSVNLPYLAGLVANFKGDFSTAQSYLKDSLEKARKFGMDANIFYIKNFACYASLYLGDFESCEKLLNEMGDIIGMHMTEENDHILAYYWTWRGHYLFVRDQCYEAAALAAQALKLREKVGGEMYLIKCLLVLGGALRESGHPQDSEQYLHEALERSMVAGSIFMQASCHLQLALLYDLLGKKQQYEDSTDSLFRIAVENSYYHFFMWRDDHVARIIDQIGGQGRYEAYLTELRRRRFHTADFGVEATLSQRIKISMLGPLAIDFDGTKHNNLGLRKPLYLLALLAVKSTPISMETIIEEMWPDMDIKFSRNNFHFTLNRLRKFMGENDYIGVKDGMYGLNTDKVWIDISHFKDLAGRAGALVESGQLSKAIGCLKEALIIYRGDLLEGETLGPLLSMESEAWSKKSYDTMVLLGKLLLQTGKYEEALKTLNTASTRSFADENTFRLLMLAHYGLCNPGQALKLYNDFEKYSASEFQTSPHRKTKELRDIIRSGKDHPIPDLIKWLT